MNRQGRAKLAKAALIGVAPFFFACGAVAATQFPLIRIEGAWPKVHNWSKAYPKMGFDGCLALREPVGPSDAQGYWAKYEFSVPRAGRYALWLVGIPLNVSWASPINVFLNGEKLDLRKARNFGHPNGLARELTTWTRLCEVDVPPGRNDLMAQVIERRKTPDTEFCFYLDEFILAPPDWKPPANKIPVLPRPANVKPRASVRRFTVDAAQRGRNIATVPFDLAQGSGPSAWPKGFVDKILPQLRALRPRYFRKDNFVPKCTKVNGEWQYDFSELDRIVDDIRAMGAEVIPCLEGAAGSFDNIPPGEVINYKAWEEYWYRVVKHFNVDRKLGIRYWEVLNEPDGRAMYRDYVKVFAAARRGAHRADPTVRVGGPACIGYDGAIPFVRKCVAAGVKPGFVSYHTYGVPGEEFVDIARRIRAEARKLTGDPTLPLIITEWGITSMCSKYWWNSLAPAFDASVYVAMARRPGCPDVATRFSMKDMLPGAEFGLFDLHDQPRPSFYAVKLFRGMTGHIVPLIGDRDDKLDGLATRDGDNVQVFLYNLEREGTPRRKIRLTILHLPQRAYRWRRAVIDPYCSNPYNRRHANPEERSLVWTRWETIAVVKGTLNLEFEMVPPGATLVQLRAQGIGR